MEAGEITKRVVHMTRDEFIFPGIGYQMQMDGYGGSFNVINVRLPSLFPSLITKLLS